MNCEAATAGLVPAAGPVVVTRTWSTAPTPTSGVTAVIDVGVDAVTAAASPPMVTAGVAVPNPEPLMVTVVPPTAAPDVGLSPVTVGQPALDPVSSVNSAGARGLPHPVARSYPGRAVYCDPVNNELEPEVTSLKAAAAPAEYMAGPRRPAVAAHP